MLPGSLEGGEETNNAKIIIRPIVAHMVVSAVEKNTDFPLKTK